MARDGAPVDKIEFNRVPQEISRLPLNIQLRGYADLLGKT
jgi:hypothetical protein